MSSSADVVLRLSHTLLQCLSFHGLTLYSGLGIGTTPTALIAHGIDTTIVEIDPVVYDFAVKYFGLPENHTAVIDDAVRYTAKLADTTDKKFDYIVHDVFTGGAEPVELFTLEFLQTLYKLLTPSGVVAIVSLGLGYTERVSCVAKMLIADRSPRTTPGTSYTHRPRSWFRQSEKCSRRAGSLGSLPETQRPSRRSTVTSPTW